MIFKKIMFYLYYFIYLFILAELSICVSNLVLLGGGLRISVNFKQDFQVPRQEIPGPKFKDSSYITMLRINPKRWGFILQDNVLLSSFLIFYFIIFIYFLFQNAESESEIRIKVIRSKHQFLSLGPRPREQLSARHLRI